MLPLKTGKKLIPSCGVVPGTVDCPPPGFRLVTKEEVESTSGLSSYLAVYPAILRMVTRYDSGHKSHPCWMPSGPKRYSDRSNESEWWAVPIDKTAPFTFDEVSVTM